MHILTPLTPTNEHTRLAGIAMAIEALDGVEDCKRDRETANYEELAAQCARALRNLSVNRECSA